MGERVRSPLAMSMSKHQTNLLAALHATSFQLPRDLDLMQDDP